MRKIEKNGGGALRGSWKLEVHGEEEGRSRMERKEEDKVLEGWRHMEIREGWRRRRMVEAEWRRGKLEDGKEKDGGDWKRYYVCRQMVDR